MNRIKVAFLVPSYAILSNEMSGSAVHIRKIAKHLSARDDIELHVLTVGDKKALFKKNELTIHVVKNFLFPFGIPVVVRRLWRKTIEINPDIVHAEGTFTPYSTTAALLIERYPTLLTVMGLIQRETKFKKGLGYLFNMLVNIPNEKYVISKIPHIIVMSPYIKNILSVKTNSKIYIVPEGIECKEIQNLELTENKENIDIFIAVRLWRLKGVDILIKAIPKVIKIIPDLKVYIAGSGEEEGNYKNMVRDLGIERHVFFLGLIPDEEQVNRYYAACKIVVVPSRWDVDPFAPLNAAAAGKPAIVSDACNSSVLEDGKTGFIFKSENVDELSMHIIKLLSDDKLREEMGMMAFKKATYYDYGEIVNKKLKIYKEVIANFKERCNKIKNVTKFDHGNLILK